MLKSCDICNNEFEAKMRTQKRCSAKCRKEHHRKSMFETTGDKSWRKIIPCIICNTGFMPKSYNGNVCSKDCKRVYSKLHMREQAKKKVKQINNVHCIVCAQPFQTVGKSATITCSKNCSLQNKAKDAHKRPYRKKPEFKLYHRLRSAVISRIKAQRVRTSEICDYTTAELKAHLESKFQNGMTWDNWGVRGWHIDHIKPVNAFVFFDECGNIKTEEIKKALSLDNLQPLWASENLKKGAKHND